MNSRITAIDEARRDRAGPARRRWDRRRRRSVASGPYEHGRPAPRSWPATSAEAKATPAQVSSLRLAPACAGSVPGEDPGPDRQRPGRGAGPAPPTRPSPRRPPRRNASGSAELEARTGRRARRARPRSRRSGARRPRPDRRSAGLEAVEAHRHGAVAPAPARRPGSSGATWPAVADCVVARPSSASGRSSSVDHVTTTLRSSTAWSLFGGKSGPGSPGAIGRRTPASPADAPPASQSLILGRRQEALHGGLGGLAVEVLRRRRGQAGVEDLDLVEGGPAARRPRRVPAARGTRSGRGAWNPLRSIRPTASARTGVPFHAAPALPGAMTHRFGFSLKAKDGGRPDGRDLDPEGGDPHAGLHARRHGGDRQGDAARDRSARRART